MDYNYLGRTGLKVSEIGLGTMNFGMTANEPESIQVMDAAYDNGINLIDTADVYGGPQSPGMEKGYGISEEIVGRWMQQRGTRDRVVLATKVYQPMETGPNDRHLSALHIRQACEASLRRLGTDHIDLYQMHHVDRATPWEEIWQAMELLVQQGKVLYVGSSNFAGWDIATAQAVAARREFLGLVSEQSVYNLSQRTVELEVIPSARYHGVGLIPYSPMGGGLLSGALTKAAEGRRSAPAMQKRIDSRRGSLEAYEAFCAEIGHKPSDVAIAWLLANPVVSSTIVGSRTPQQTLDSLAGADISLSEEEIARLDEIWPGPGGEAPEAYAW